MGANVPRPQSHAAAAWSGDRMIVWGGTPATNTGGRYDPTTDSWQVTSTGPGTPSARYNHTAIWADTQMIVWGGNPALNTGGRYDPIANSWIPTGTGANTPAARETHTAVWTGGEMIVWGGSLTAASGGRYCVSGCVPTTWFRDFDGDGYGNINDVLDECTQPPGYVSFPTDCDDTNSSIHPGAA